LAKNKKNKNLPWNLVHLFVRLSIPHFILIQMAAMHNHFLFLILSWYRWLQCTIIFYSSFHLDTNGCNAQSFFIPHFILIQMATMHNHFFWMVETSKILSSESSSWNDNSRVEKVFQVQNRT
jgi:hypothetical protein